MNDILIVVIFAIFLEKCFTILTLHFVKLTCEILITK